MTRDDRTERLPGETTDAAGAARPELGRNSWIALLGEYPQQRVQLIAALAKEGVRVLDELDPSFPPSPTPALVLIDDATIDVEGEAQVTKLRAQAPAPLFLRFSEDAVEVPATIATNDADPFEPLGTGDLLQRVQKIVRQVQATGRPPMRFVLDAGDLQCDLGRQAALVNGRTVALSPTQYRLFVTFMKNAGNTLTHEQLLLSVWGPTYFREVDYLRVQIGRLRQKLELSPTSPQYFVSAPGVGYRLTNAVTDGAARV